MASHFHLFLTFLIVVTLFVTPSISLTCSSSNNAHFINCADLPSLKASLHWTYDTTKSTLSIAYIASPASPDGWIAWGINPTKLDMIGTQSLRAFQAPNGFLFVKTYNLTSNNYITESKISYHVLDSKAESSNGVMKIFATLALPEKTVKENHVWQVGTAVKDGIPVGHKLDPDNLKSKATLDLVTSASIMSGQSENITGGSATIMKNGTSTVFTFLFVIGILLLKF
ncbi:cytochrome b561 and DOMON domain-containing protein At3g25290-like [Lycium barbarum]|uniref:cytochrome b561 and DOMON domain-containing protein At3g25290-like n=1 Tax=Lycium barbarum TaxID=112863 RepID=UPI00293F7866|nr:cytochrome b561 and DOMON domain-containing protein At3g25290-like [Lycium barbarum]